MGKGKSKQYGYDIVDNDEQAEVTLQDFVIPSKIDAFGKQFEPLDHWTEDCEVFNDARLREYFKAIVCPLERNPSKKWTGSNNQHVIDIQQSLQKGEIVLWKC